MFMKNCCIIIWFKLKTTYGHICLIQVLRENENSILAVLETFVYDPLINWRLVEDYAEDGARDSAYQVRL